MKVIIAVLCVLFFASSSYADEIDTLKKVNDMIADLNGTSLQHKHFNGVVLTCKYGGTKKITIKFDNGTAKYSAYYNNCKENNVVRDAVYEIETVNDIVTVDNERRTANGELFDAVTANDMKKVNTILNDKADVNYSEKMPIGDGKFTDSWTPLMSAAANGNLEIVDLLVRRGAWVNYLNGNAQNALWLATYFGHEDVVKFLLKHGGYFDNADIDNITPLMLASMGGNSEIADLLLSAGAAINCRHKDGDSALMFSIANKNTEIAKKLIDAGADINIQNKFGISALIIASVENNIEIAEYLIKKGADISAKTNFNKTALDISIAKGHTQLAQLLTKAAVSKKSLGK